MYSRLQKWSLVFFALFLFAALSTPVFARAGGGGGKGGGAGNIFLVLIYGVYYIVWRLYVNYRSYRVSKSLEAMAEQDTKWDAQEIKHRVDLIYFMVQGAWNDRDMAKAKACLSEYELNQLQELISKNTSAGERNILEDIELHSVEIVGFFDHTTDSLDKVQVLINGSMVDYKICTTTGDITQNSEKKSESFWEIWTLRYTRDGWCLDDISESTGITDIMTLQMDCEDKRYCYSPAIRRTL